jgi:four helix bundle suffix protein
MSGKEDDGLIPRHGGYRNLKTFQLAEVIYDVTMRFCELFLDPRSRTVDQMVQAARSGRQNIAEGSMDSATSKKMALKLTAVARGSLEELRLDYEDDLRQRGLPIWGPDHPALARFKALRCGSLAVFREWIGAEVKLEQHGRHGQARTNTDKDTDGDDEGTTINAEGTARRGKAKCHEENPHKDHRDPESPQDPARRVRESPCSSVSPSVFAANGALSLLNLCLYLLNRQLQAQAKTFVEEGGFTERLYQKRIQARREKME